MMVCLDVDYRESGACAAAVLFLDWTDAAATGEEIVSIPTVQPYESGQFYRRELPCLLAILRVLPPVDVVIVDGYVWLGENPGLGAHLYHALDANIPVIGVAKTRFQGADRAREVIRGTSKRPLLVTAAGMPVEQAAEHVRSIHGDHRIPTLLARVDRLCR